MNAFLGPDTDLPMMFMPDAIKATIDLMEADASEAFPALKLQCRRHLLQPKNSFQGDKKTHPRF